MFTKNHFGAHTSGDASHLHNGLVAPTEAPNISRPGYGLYRIQVDLMEYYLLVNKNLFYLMDALWATDYEPDIPLKWEMPPFNDDYLYSVFASQFPEPIQSFNHNKIRYEGR